MRMATKWAGGSDAYTGIAVVIASRSSYANQTRERRGWIWGEERISSWTAENGQQDQDNSTELSTG